VCGISGLLDPRAATPADRLLALASGMAATLAHRGPDDEGVWADEAAGVAFGFRRLSIVDLSPAGRQPMTSGSGRYTIVFNGELYDHAAVRAELEGRGHRFRGHSDTEVLLAGIEEWGLVGALRRGNGMFGLAVWDAQRRVLHLARDRLGEKPLYYGIVGGWFAFGSELKALRALPGWDGEVDPGALSLFLRWTYVPSPWCIHAGIRKLLPGTVLSVPAGAVSLPEPVPYWSLASSVEREPFRGDPIEAVAALLADSVRLRMRADVPVGAFLSGGVDSSTVVALMGPSARTFTVAMPDAGFDESREAAAVARHLGTDHTTVELSAADALAAVPRLPAVYDEPFADPSALPTMLVSEAARGEVTVALSGDGGDEVFAGYNRHVLSRWAARRFGRLPRGVRSAAAASLMAVGARRWDAVAGRLAPVLPRALRVRDPGTKAQKLAALLRSDDGAAHAALATQWEGVPPLAAPVAEPPLALAAALPDALDDPTERMLFADTAMGLPDGMLTKVDRASMAVGLEARLPLLDHRLVELAWSLPLDLKIRGDVGKWVLRQVLARHVPSELVDRPKMGFDPPVGAWLRGPLHAWADELLSPGALAAAGLDAGRVRARWAEHLSGRRAWDYDLWTVLAYQAWRASC
jgi:asparagine synthase (glutamine-hydrolysing)